MAKKISILLVYTGGTIGMIKDKKTNALKPFNFSQIVAKIPELEQLNCTIKSISFDKPIDSSNMNTVYYKDIVEIIEKNYKKFDGFVILTGSDTMSYASSAVSFMLDNLQKPIIFTGSQLPIGDLRTDAKENLITAIEIASTYKKGKPVISEVCLYFEYKLYRANRTTKISADQFEAFASMNFPPLAESGVHLKFNEHLIHQPKNKEQALIVHKNLVDEVVILKLFPGISILVVKSILNIPNLKGVVLETYGSGNASNSEDFINLLKEAIKKGIKIINVTQCKRGAVMMGDYDTSLLLKKIGVISGGDITIESAISKLMYLLDKKLSDSDFNKMFKKSIRGEITNNIDF
ncbi:asparaginase [uncultured Polaribacter sp.]|uniref:asparaginase n=1 Tax=uncultured Polaribacter sp. TaxID=174711 RepID=UPI002620BEA8|nr:type I asparaginase [uncultured Polaribacter sp.]